DRAELQFATVIGAVLGGVTGYLLCYMVESGGWFKILIFVLIGAVVGTGMVFCLRSRHRGGTNPRRYCPATPSERISCFAGTFQCLHASTRFCSLVAIVC